MDQRRGSADIEAATWTSDEGLPTSKEQHMDQQDRFVKVPANIYDLGIINMIFEADYANMIIGNIMILA